VRDKPAGVSETSIIEALAAAWGIEARTLEYVPIGAGSYHWRAREGTGQAWWVTADDLSWSGVSTRTDPDGIFDDLRAGFTAARQLRDDGLGFVLAPVPGKDGGVVHRVVTSWALSVCPYVEAENAGAYGEWRSPALRLEAARLVAELHRARPPAAIRRWDAEIPCRYALETALSALDVRWRDGPYGEPVRDLLSGCAMNIQEMLRAYDRLAGEVMRSPEPWVVTHGEPHSANFLEVRDGHSSRLQLIDWDTVRLAPRERDLAVLASDDEEALHAYREVAGDIVPRAEALRLFGLRWTLTDVATWIRRLRSPHEGSEDDKRAWEGLTQSLSRATV
jgi:spectinomycin phosphotransferase